MDREFALAREIQQRLLPEDPPPLPGYELHGSNVASRQVSGDYFDFRPRNDGKIYMTIADVCGKGVGPALLMASLQASFHAWADEGVPVAEMTGRLSEAISRRTGPDRFITFFLLILDPASGEVEYTNAGHNPGLLLHADGSIEELGSHGLPLALFPGKTLRLVSPRALSGRAALPLHGRRHRGERPGGQRVRPAAPEGGPGRAGAAVARGHRGGARALSGGARQRGALRGRPDAGDGAEAAGLEVWSLELNHELRASPGSPAS